MRPTGRTVPLDLPQRLTLISPDYQTIGTYVFPKNVTMRFAPTGRTSRADAVTCYVEQVRTWEGNPTCQWEKPVR